MKSLIVAAILVVSTNAFAQVTTRIEFTPSTMNCLVANNTGSDIRVNTTYYSAQSNIGVHNDYRECNNNCIVPAGLIARFRGPNNNPQIITAGCEVNYTSL